MLTLTNYVCLRFALSFGRATALSLDHNPESEIEAIRVHNAGGTVTKEGRINGNLAVSRTIGKEPGMKQRAL